MLANCPGLRAVSSGSRTVASGTNAIQGSARSPLSGSRATHGGAHPVNLRASPEIRLAYRLRVAEPSCIARVERRVATRCHLVARRGHHIALLGDGVTTGGDFDPDLRRFLALVRRAVANFATRVVKLGVAPPQELAIAGSLVLVGGGLIAVCRRLVAVGS